MSRTGRQRSAVCYHRAMKRTDPKRRSQHRDIKSLALDTLSAVKGGVIERDDQLLTATVGPASDPRA